MTGDGEPSPDGQLIGGRYRLLEPLGAGPSGTVWRARDEQDQRDVAVKEPVLPGDPADGEERRRIAHRLYTEARAAARVRHPSAVTLYDVVTEDGLPWIVMELVHGESLREAVGRAPLEPAEAARVGLAVLGALRAAHAVGIVHRDLKPANVLIESGTGRVVVTDFGIGDGHAGEGPVEFVAPERASGRGAGPASDLWSLGALLAAAVEGGGAGPLGSLLTRLHAPEPQARPGAEEVAAVLEACGGVLPLAETTPEPEPGPRPEQEARPEPGPRPAPPAPLPVSPTPAHAPAPAPTPDHRRRTPLAALGLLLAKKPGAE
ncbi:serine/threonine-protein kinase [Streptomyces sp. NPDC001165]|uniref:serine/threonine-protein kinase n=1 Tax=Streptomyces sp. NPDC001165 TaxID=3364546 RepID=UPI0036C3BFCF